MLVFDWVQDGSEQRLPGGQDSSGRGSLGLSGGDAGRGQGTDSTSQELTDAS